MLIQMLADRFAAGGVLYAKGTQVNVADDLAFRWIGDGVATDVGGAREAQQGTQDLVSGAGMLPATLDRVYKPIGNSITPGSVSNTTYQCKLAIPADATSVGLIFFHHDVSNALTGVRACVAATEAFYTAVGNDDMRHPFVGGVAYKVLDDVSSLYGWRSTTWAGANSPTLPQPPAIGGVGFAGLSNVPSIAATDMVALPDVPPSAADIAAGGDPAWRYVMWRVYVPGAAGNKYAFYPGTNSLTKSDINKGWVMRFGSSGGDVVTTAVNTTCGDAPSTTLPVAVVYRTKTAGLQIMFVGDSTVQGQGSGVSAESMIPWPLRATIAAGAKWGCINIGCSSQTQATFYAAGISALAALKPHVALFQVGSPNDNTSFGTVLAMQQYLVTAMGRVGAFITACQAASTRPVLSTFMPCPASGIASSALGASIDALRRAHNDKVRALCAGGAALLFDYDAYMSDGGTVDAFGVHRIKAALTGDALHPNEAGSVVLGAACAADVLARFA